jgi:hypothetical protein
MIDQDDGRTANEEQASASSPRQRAIEAYEGARGRATDTLGQAPLLALAGGIAAGALIAALLPTTEAETRAVRPTARRVKASARAAIDAARETSRKRFDELGYTRAKGEETFQSILKGLKDTAQASADAAVDAVRNKG